MFRVLAEHRELDALFFDKAGIIRAEQLEPDPLVLALLGEGFLLFRQRVKFFLARTRAFGR